MLKSGFGSRIWRPNRLPQLEQPLNLLIFVKSNLEICPIHSKTARRCGFQRAAGAVFSGPPSNNGTRLYSPGFTSASHSTMTATAPNAAMLTNTSSSGMLGT
jgi:hypothetical protein